LIRDSILSNLELEGQKHSPSFPCLRSVLKARRLIRC